MQWLRRAVLGSLLAGMVLTGCNFAVEGDPDPTTRPDRTPVAWATVWTPTATSEATLTPLPSATDAPTLTPPPSAPPTETPLPSKTRLPTLTPPPTVTPTEVTVTPLPTETVAPTMTAAQSERPAPATEIVGVTRTYAPPPSFTPPPSWTPVPPSATPVPPTITPIPQAIVCADCGGLRLRSGPGVASSIITQLGAGTPLSIIGRTGDSAWVQVVLPDGTNGWVSASYLTVNIGLANVAVTGALPTAAPTAVAANAAPFDVASIVSGVSSNARTIFLNGLAKGNLPHVFTRVGDSITAAPQFLTQIGQGTYRLGDYGYLQTAINFFSGPNARGLNPYAGDSAAAHNSWGADSVLNPALADPGRCKSGETPLVCEYRTVKPAVALIMVGTNDSGGIPAATFQANLQRIVQISIDMGVIPVLSTIPPKHYNPATDGRVQEFNQIIIATARGYDVPLWDYYSAMRALPGEGLHADGVHPSTPPDGITTIFDASHLEYGYTVRNLTALQVLYALWQYVLYDADQLLASGVPTPSAGVPAGDPAGDPPGYSCPGTAMIPLVIGQQGRVTPGLPNKLRAEPALASEQIGSIPGEGVFEVLDGPRCVDGYNWWKVWYDGMVGWTADGTPDDPWLQP